MKKQKKMKARKLPKPTPSFVILISLVIVFLAIPLTVFLSGKQQDLQEHAAGNGGTQAKGILTFYNGNQVGACTINAGTIVTDKNGVQITTDGSVTIPPGNPLKGYGSNTVSAHAVQPGSQGNIPAKDFNYLAIKVCPTGNGAYAGFVSNMQAFAGGSNGSNPPPILFSGCAGYPWGKSACAYSPGQNCSQATNGQFPNQQYTARARIDNNACGNNAPQSVPQGSLVMCCIPGSGNGGGGNPSPQPTNQPGGGNGGLILSGTIFADYPDKDGVWNNGEQAVNNLNTTITLTDSSGKRQTTNSTVGGEYAFYNLTSGSYKITTSFQATNQSSLESIDLTANNYLVNIGYPGSGGGNGGGGQGGNGGSGGGGGTGNGNVLCSSSSNPQCSFSSSCSQQGQTCQCADKGWANHDKVFTCNNGQWQYQSETSNFTCTENCQ